MSGERRNILAAYAKLLEAQHLLRGGTVVGRYDERFDDFEYSEPRTNQLRGLLAAAQEAMADALIGGDS